MEAGDRVQVAKRLGCQAKELGLYLVGAGEPFMGCKQGSDLFKHHNETRALEISSDEAKLL